MDTENRKLKPAHVHTIINPAAGKEEPILTILNKAFGSANISWEAFVTQAYGDAERAE